MNQINLLRETLKPHLGWHGARLNFLALFLIALLRVKTINLVELATGFRNHAKTDSNYKRLQRFFREFNLDYVVIAKLVVALMNIPQPWVLSLDRTEWSFGETRFNILTLGIVHEGIAYPVVWKMLDKKGNSNTAERVDSPKTRSNNTNCNSCKTSVMPTITATTSNPKAKTKSAKTSVIFHYRTNHG